VWPGHTAPGRTVAGTIADEEGEEIDEEDEEEGAREMQRMPSRSSRREVSRSRPSGIDSHVRPCHTAGELLGVEDPQ
jgi:hypothetical protein